MQFARHYDLIHNRDLFVVDVAPLNCKIHSTSRASIYSRLTAYIIQTYCSTLSSSGRYREILSATGGLNKGGKREERLSGCRSFGTIGEYAMGIRGRLSKATLNVSRMFGMQDQCEGEIILSIIDLIPS